MYEDREEELMELLAKRISRYTHNESTSVTYEVARQLMASVLYVLEGAREETEGSGLIPVSQALPLQQLYEIGKRRKEEKVKQAKALYEEIKDNFLSVGNRCCTETILEGIPEFFLRYDLEFDAQNTILTLDYPLHRPVKGKNGIDLIYAYLQQFRKEQEFLNSFPKEVIEEILWEYHTDYQELVINLYEVVIEKLPECLLLASDSRLLQERQRLRKWKECQVQEEFIDGEMMQDDKLRRLIEEMKACRYTSDKIAMIHRHVHSLADLKEILEECIWEEERQEVLKLLSPQEQKILEEM